MVLFEDEDSEQGFLPFCMSECKEEDLPAYEPIQEIDEDIKPPEYQVVIIEELPPGYEVAVR